MKTLPEAIAAARAGQKSALRCPNAHGHKHGDRNPSLSVFPGKNSWVGVKCFSGCNRDDILAAAGLKVRDLGPDRPFEPRQRPSRPSISFLLPPPPPPPPTDDSEKAAKRRLWPRLMVPEVAVLERIRDVRGISVEGLELAVERGILRSGYHEDRPCWFVTDERRIAAQARRIDGLRFRTADGPKGLSLEGTVGGWPIGAAAIQPEHRSILFCEGGPDLLAAHASIWAEGREHDAAAVAMLGASSPIADEAVELFRGRKVRFVVHADTAGDKGLLKWGAQLRGIAVSRDSICFKGLHRADGTPVKDLNDALLVDADTFEKARILWGLVP
jgi:hypothetical protein